MGLSVAIAEADPGFPAGPLPGERPARLSEIFPPEFRSDASLAEELQRIVELEAQLAAYKADLVVELGYRRPAALDVPRGRPGAAAHRDPDEALLPELAGTSEFLADEVAEILNCSRAAASTLVRQAFTMRCRLPATWARLADGVLDWPRARGLLAELGGPATDETPPALLTAVEASLLPIATDVSVRRLRELARRELLARDPESADRRRRTAERAADVTLCHAPDGLCQLLVLTGADRAVALHDAIDRYARMLRAEGDPRPIGQIRVDVLEDLVLRPWDTTRPPVTALLTVVAPLTALTHLRTGAGGGGPGAAPETSGATGPAGPRPDPAAPAGERRPPAEVDGRPITAGQLRALLEQLEALCPGGLQRPPGGGLRYALTDADGRLRATVDDADLRRLAHRGCPTHAGGDCGCAVLDRPGQVDRYRPSPSQRRFITTRDRTCRHPGCSNRAGWADLDHVVPHASAGPTACENLCCLCRRHHRLKTHARGWVFAMSDDGVLTVTTPSGVTRVSRPPGLTDQAVAAAAVYPPADDPPPF